MYKIVSNQNGKLVSACHPILADAVVQYIPGQFVGPVVKGSALLVFDTIDHAKEFLMYEGNELWSCEVVQIDKPMLVNFNSKGLIENFSKKSFPEGTVFVSMVKLLKRI